MAKRLNKKIFVKTKTNNLDIFENPKNENYYSYIAKQKENGYRQILITTDQMIKILEMYANNYNAHIMGIDLFEADDLEYKRNIDECITALNKKLISFKDFIQQLEMINTENSVDIQSLEFNYKFNDNNFILKIYLNGIIYISDYGEISRVELNKLIKNIEFLSK